MPFSMLCRHGSGPHHEVFLYTRVGVVVVLDILLLQQRVLVQLFLAKRVIDIAQASMDHRVCKQVTRKGKKKHNGKDEFDRVKQAEKKKKRIEKALATSAAIRAALEKKKQMKLEEQRRLDEEGAAIAEAAALHVLLGEDSEDGSMLGEGKCYNIDLFTGERTNYVPRKSYASYAVQGIGFESNVYGRGDSNGSVPYKPFMRGGAWDNKMGVSVDLIAAQVVSSLHISENNDRNAFVFNRMYPQG